MVPPTTAPIGIAMAICSRREAQTLGREAEAEEDGRTAQYERRPERGNTRCPEPSLQQ